MKISVKQALQNAKHNPGRKFPSCKDARFIDGMSVPVIQPRFTIAAPSKVFTIGSCFARNIEEALFEADVELPTRAFSVPENEWAFRPNGLLNEYNPGTMLQRVMSAAQTDKVSDETIVPDGDGYVDLMLPGGTPVTFERVKERRREIDSVYEELPSSDLAIVTLGLIEAWFDDQTGLFLNRMPPMSSIRKEPQRFSLRRLEVSESCSLLEKAIATMIGMGVKNILLTVSPVPMHTTFTENDAVVANSLSKSTLRVCAGRLKEQFPSVDYFPSYEIISSCGSAAFIEDNVHVKNEVVRRVVKMMMDAYLEENGARRTADAAKSHE